MSKKINTELQYKEDVDNLMRGLVDTINRGLLNQDGGRGDLENMFKAIRLLEYVCSPGFKEQLNYFFKIKQTLSKS